MSSGGKRIITGSRKGAGSSQAGNKAPRVAPTPAAREEELPAREKAPADLTFNPLGSPGVAPASGAHGSRLSVMPLSVLLPTRDGVAKLPAMERSLKRRLQELAAERDAAGGEASKEHHSEESMLNQVLRWLADGSSGE